MSTTTRKTRRAKRTFTRDSQIGFRAPNELKVKLQQHARCTYRDISDLMIEYARKGLERDGVQLLYA